LVAPIFGSNSADVEATAIAIIRRSRCSRIVGLEHIDTSDGMTDSYYSELSDYASQKPGDAGHICSNGPIHVHPGVIINGNAAPGLDDSVTIGPTGVVTGSTVSNTREIVVPPIDVGRATVVNDNENIPLEFLDKDGNLELNGLQSLTLPPGIYYIDGNLKIAGQAFIEITGPTVLYVRGTTDIAGEGVVNVTQLPENLRLYPMGADAKFAGNAALYADIHAPETHVEIKGNGGLFGAVVGKTLYLNGETAIHADLSLPYGKYSPVDVYLVH
jgi:hypothetical protein